MEKFSIDPETRLLLFNALLLFEVAGEDEHAKLHAQVADEQQKRDADRPPLSALVVDVNICDP